MGELASDANCGRRRSVARLGHALLVAWAAQALEPASVQPARADGLPGRIVRMAGGPGQGRALDLSHDPSALAIAGRFLFIADERFHAVRRLDLDSGTSIVVAGTGKWGYSGDGGPGADAQLWKPVGVAVDASGNVYIADRDNYRVRRIDAATGDIVTVAGGGPFGPYRDGALATDVALLFLDSVAIDPANGIAIAHGDLISRVDPGDGTLSIVAGTGGTGYGGDGGPATEALLNRPTGIVFDRDGNLVFADSSNRRVRRIDRHTGTIETIAGNGRDGGLGDGGPALAAGIAAQSLAYDPAGNLFVLEGTRVRRIDAATTVVTTIAGGSFPFGADGGPALNAQFFYPSAIAVDAAGNVFVADQGHRKVRRIDAATGIIDRVAGNGSPNVGGHGGPATDVQMQPGDVAVAPSGDIFITDPQTYDPDRLLRVDAATGIATVVAGVYTGGLPFGDGGPAAQAAFSSVGAVAVNPQGDVFIADTDRVRRIDAATGLISTFAHVDALDLVFDRDGNLFVLGTAVHRIDAATSEMTRIAGGGNTVPGDGGPATEASLRFPQGIALDRDGNLYIAMWRGDIRRVDAATGTIETIVADSWGTSTQGYPAYLELPVAIEIDDAGILYVAEFGGDRVRRIDLMAGEDYAIAGNGQLGCTGDGGPAAQALLNTPSRLALDGVGGLMVVDRGNDRIRRIDLTRGCGNALGDVGEQCDDGNSARGDGCAPDCTFDLCGNGRRDFFAGESCDLGSDNGASHTCCTRDCHLRSAGEVCRPAAGTCDAAEVCLGGWWLCPWDEPLPDADGDATCDTADICPQTSDPEQTDADADGLGDACDPCTNPDADLAAPRLSTKAVPRSTAGTRVRASARLGLPAVVDPIATGLRLTVEDATGRILGEASAPSGPFDLRLRRGWSADATQSAFRYRAARDRSGDGIERVELRRVPGSGDRFAVDVRGFLPDADASSAPLPLRAIVTLDASDATSHQCAELRFAASSLQRCSVPSRGRIECR